MSQNAVFQNKWIEEAVRQCLGKPEGDISPEEIIQIQYLKIGRSYDFAFITEMSTTCPPDPFVDTDGGDEWWACCLREEQITQFLQDEGLQNTQLSVFGFDHEEWEYAEEDKAREDWEQFKDTVKVSRYLERIEDYKDKDAWEAWYEKTAGSFWQDISLFTGLRVLRVMGGSFPDFKALEPLTNLKTAEFVETSFDTDEAIETLSRLNQLCCWMD